MNKQFLLTFLFLLTLLGVVAVPPAQAADLHFASPQAPGATAYRYKGEAATAYYSYTNDGCIYTDLYVFAGETTSKSGPGAPVKGKVADFSLNQYDFCNDAWLSGAYGYVDLTSANFSIDNKLNNAHLQSNVAMYDWNTGNSFDLAVDLTWTGIGDLTRNKSSYQYESGGCKVKSRFSGSYRMADVSGIISDGTTNYAANPAYYADLQSVKGGNMGIGCGW